MIVAALKAGPVVGTRVIVTPIETAEEGCSVGLIIAGGEDLTTQMIAVRHPLLVTDFRFCPKYSVCNLVGGKDELCIQVEGAGVMEFSMLVAGSVKYMHPTADFGSFFLLFLSPGFDCLVHRCYVDRNNNCPDARPSSWGSPYPWSCQACRNNQLGLVGVGSVGQ